MKGYLDRDLLSYNMFEPALEPFQINTVVSETVQMLTPEAKAQQMDITLMALKQDIIL